MLSCYVRPLSKTKFRIYYTFLKFCILEEWYKQAKKYGIVNPNWRNYK